MMMMLMLMMMMMMMMMCVCVDIARVFYTSSWYVPCAIEGDQPYGGPPLTERNRHIYAPASLLSLPPWAWSWFAPFCGPVVRVDWCDCWLMESYSLQVVLSCMVFARKFD